MIKYACYDCGCEFETCGTKSVIAEEYYGVSSQFESSHSMDIACCPNCGSDDFYEEYFEDEEDEEEDFEE